jgi:hypothetical protein
VPGSTQCPLAEREDQAITSAKRHLGRSVAGVGVAVASVLIGLEAPAFAVSPTISSFSPTSGPSGCVIVITGTDFDNPDVSSVDIGGTPVTAFKVVSATTIWATVAGTTSGTIHVTNSSGMANSPTDFTNTNPGACSPAIKSFTPCSGTAGTTVVITGMNLLKDSGTTTTAAVGGDVRFAPYTATATHTGAPETPTQLSVLAPSDVADGPIRVSTFNEVGGEGAVLSEIAFQVPPPDVHPCGPPVAEHPRSVTLHLRRHLVARGEVSVGDGFTDCAATVPVKIQRRLAGHWRTVRTTTTSPRGTYRRRIPDRPGRYRTRAPKLALSDGTNICARAISPVRLRS